MREVIAALVLRQLLLKLRRIHIYDGCIQRQNELHRGAQIHWSSKSARAGGEERLSEGDEGKGEEKGELSRESAHSHRHLPKQ